jgi:hypothetical protein
MTTASALPTGNSAELLHQLQGHQRKLSAMQQSSATDVPPSASQSASPSQVEDLRLEVERLRELMVNMGINPPPQYQD